MTGCIRLTIIAGILFVLGCPSDAHAQVPDPSWQWAWMHGADTFKSPIVYVAQGVPHPDNTPGFRSNPLTWTDTSGNFWLFGGSYYRSALDQGELSDLWMFDVNTYEWTFVHGA
jgi:hypothetical protein